MSSTVATSQQVLNTNSDIYWLNWLFLAESIFGFLTNTVNLVVFANQRRFKEIRYKYILVKTIANWLYFILNTMSAFLTYCLDCSSTQTYFAVIYSVYVSLYLCSSLTGLRELIQLAMSVRTYLVMTQKSQPSKSYYILVIVLLTILSLVTYLYIPFAFGFFQNPLTGAYLYYLNSFGSSKVYYVLVLVQTFLFIAVSAVAVAFLNCANMISFKRWLFRRRVKRVINSQAVLFEAEPNIAVAIAKRNETLANVKNSSHDEATQIKKNLTKTIIISLSFNIVFEIAFSIMLLLIAFYSTAANFFRLSMIGIIIHNIAPSLDLFVYFYVNKLFRKVLSSMFKCSRTT